MLSHVPLVETLFERFRMCDHPSSYHVAPAIHIQNLISDINQGDPTALFLNMSGLTESPAGWQEKEIDNLTF